VRVLRTIPSFYPAVTGPANQAWNISRRLKKKGIHSTIVTSTVGAESAPKEELLDNLHIKRLSIRSGYIQYGYMPLIIGNFLKEEYDIVHAHSYRNCLADAGFIAAKFANKPFILQTHGSLLGYKYMLNMGNWKLYKLYDLFTFKSMVRSADAVITSTEQEFTEALEFGIDRSKLRIIPVGIEAEKYVPVKKRSNALRILFVGRIGASRNIEQILYAFKEIARKYKDVELYIVGGEAGRSFAEKKGYLPELKAISRKLKIYKKVVFTGYLSGDDLINAYTSSDIFVYTSLYENFGQTILEAAAAGLPVIATPVGVANDIVINDKTGYLVNFGDVKGLISGLHKLIKNEPKRKRMGSNMRAIIERNYRWDKIINLYVTLYKDVLGNPKR
jgi:glycosyltransferase involved in cell wall biosynthesis